MTKKLDTPGDSAKDLHLHPETFEARSLHGGPLVSGDTAKITPRAMRGDGTFGLEDDVEERERLEKAKVRAKAGPCLHCGGDIAVLGVSHDCTRVLLERVEALGARAATIEDVEKLWAAIGALQDEKLGSKDTIRSTMRVGDGFSFRNHRGDLFLIDLDAIKSLPAPIALFIKAAAKALEVDSTALQKVRESAEAALRRERLLRDALTSVAYYGLKGTANGPGGQAETNCPCKAEGMRVGAPCCRRCHTARLETALALLKEKP